MGRMEQGSGTVQKLKCSPGENKARRLKLTQTTRLMIPGPVDVEEDILEALRQAGIEADEAIFTQADLRPGKLMRRYRDDPAFEETLFQVA